MPLKKSETCQEISDYPNNPIVKYITSKQRFMYEIIEAGIQPPESYLARTQKPNAFPISDKYIVKTTYGKSKITITCFVEYIAKRPHFKIIFGSDPDDFVCSNLSATTVANAFITVYNKKKADKHGAKGLIPKSKING
ncbi:12463_t:CDS:2, partial [Gigaspora rosea]